MEITRLQLLLVSFLIVRCEEYQTTEPTSHLVRRGLLDSILPSTFTDGGQPGKASPNIAQSASGLLDSVTGWFSSPTPEEQARKKQEALKAEQEEKTRRQVQDIRQAVLRIPGVGLADTITRKTTSAIGLGLGYGTGKAQTLINNVYSRLRIASERKEENINP